MNAAILALFVLLPAAATGPQPEPTLPVGPSTDGRPVSEVFFPEAIDYPNLLFDCGRQEPTGTDADTNSRTRAGSTADDGPPPSYDDTDDDTADALRCGTRDARRAS